MARRRRSGSGTGPSLGAAVLDLIDEPARSTPKLKLRYMLSKRYGSPRDTVLRYLGVHDSTLRRWMTGKQKPSAASIEKINTAYVKFWETNNPALARGRFDIVSIPEGGITVVGADRANWFVEDSPDREWGPVLAARTPEEAWIAFAQGPDDGEYTSIISLAPSPPISRDYLWFETPGYTYTITVV